MRDQRGELLRHAVVSRETRQMGGADCLLHDARWEAGCGSKKPLSSGGLLQIFCGAPTPLATAAPPVSRPDQVRVKLLLLGHIRSRGRPSVQDPRRETMPRNCARPGCTKVPHYRNLGSTTTYCRVHA